jgi:MYXO-CTERM domain-containing protein
VAACLDRSSGAGGKQEVGAVSEAGAGSGSAGTTGFQRGSPRGPTLSARWDGPGSTSRAGSPSGRRWDDDGEARGRRPSSTDDHIAPAREQRRQRRRPSLSALSWGTSRPTGNSREGVGCGIGLGEALGSLTRYHDAGDRRLHGQWRGIFGISVSVSDGTALVGAYFDDHTGTDSGAAYVFAVLGALGTPCTDESECTSGSCVDGACCAAPCSSGPPNDAGSGAQGGGPSTGSGGNGGSQAGSVSSGAAGTASVAGSGGQAGSGGSAAGTSPDAGRGYSESGDSGSCGCRLAGSRDRAPGPAAWLGLLALWLWQRRRMAVRLPELRDESVGGGPAALAKTPKTGHPRRGYPAQL